MFNEKYKKDELYWGRKPNKNVKLILRYIKKGEILDLGVGEGRNSLFLAQKGFNVTGVDISKEGIEKFKKLALEKNLNVKTFVQDIREYKFEKEYDVIISNATLHFLNEKDAKNIIEKMKKHTKKEGLNVISVFTEDNPNKKFSYLFKKQELKSHYKNWEILEYKEFISPLEKHGKNGRWHRHGIGVIIARKKN